MFTRRLAGMTLLALAMPVLGESPSPAMSAKREAPLQMKGTWIMSAAYEIKADGTRTTNYGEHPH